MITLYRHYRIILQKLFLNSTNEKYTNITESVNFTSNKFDLEVLISLNLIVDLITLIGYINIKIHGTQADNNYDYLELLLSESDFNSYIKVFRWALD